MSIEAFPAAKGHTLRRVAIIIILGILTLLVILKLSGFKASWEVFRTVDPRLIIAAFVIYYATFLIRALRWKILLRALGQNPSTKVILSYLLVGWFISAAVPARAGDVVRAYLLKNDRHIPLRVGLSSIFVERGLDGLAILSCSLLFSFFLRSLGLPRWVLTLYQVTFSVFFVTLICLYFIPRLEVTARKLAPPGRYQKLVRFLFRLIDNIRLIAKSRTGMIVSLLLTLIIWFCDALVTYLILMGLDFPLPLPWVAFISFTVNLAATIPITPGAVGQIDAVQFSLFALIGVPRGVSAVTIFISRFICFWSFLLVSGLVTYGSGMVQLVRGVPGRGGLIQATAGPTFNVDDIVPEGRK